MGGTRGVRTGAGDTEGDAGAGHTTVPLGEPPFCEDSPCAGRGHRSPGGTHGCTEGNGTP